MFKLGVFKDAFSLDKLQENDEWMDGETEERNDHQIIVETEKLETPSFSASRDQTLEVPTPQLLPEPPAYGKTEHGKSTTSKIGNFFSLEPTPELSASQSQSEPPAIGKPEHTKSTASKIGNFFSLDKMQEVQM